GYAENRGAWLYPQKHGQGRVDRSPASPTVRGKLLGRRSQKNPPEQLYEAGQNASKRKAVGPGKRGPGMHRRGPDHPRNSRPTFYQQKYRGNPPQKPAL